MSVKYISENSDYGYHFLESKFIPQNKDEYYLRNEQIQTVLGTVPEWQNLTDNQIKILEANNNFSSDWQKVLVTKNFNPNSIKNSSFYGLVRIGDTNAGLLRYHDLVLQEGIRNSCIISCDIGNHCAIHNCSYISHYIIGNNVILHQIDEMDTTNHSKFGNGIIKEDEDESVRIWIQPLNEAGGREILPFSDMICADAYIWTIFRDDKALMQSLFDLTNRTYDSRRGFYGTVGSNSVIKSCYIIKDVCIGESAYIKGANKLKNLTIKSDEASSTQIGEGVELVNGIIGYGCHVFYGCKAVRFVMCNNSNLKYGARLIHSILGDNSTISCCEVLNNLVFPGHEQHHNNSFLIASLIMGQSNMAAGATVGSNHNSRGNDGEIIAGRGFWPGLSSTLKHNSHFASYTLITRGNYPNELNIPLPFSMVVENPQDNHIEVMPAYYWMYNMYALERNSWKYQIRDKRIYKTQHIVIDYLAPDTAQEIIKAIQLLEEWTGKAVILSLGEKIPKELEKISSKGRTYLKNTPENAKPLTVIGENMEHSKRPVYIIKATEAYNAYRQMLIMFAIKALIAYFEESGTSPAAFLKTKTDSKDLKWLNLGGQLMPEKRFEKIRNKIVAEKYKTWTDLHKEYDEAWKNYKFDAACCALETLKFVYGDLSKETWNLACGESYEIRKYIDKQVYITKLKDYTNSFRACTYRNQKEQLAVLGKVEDNSFIKTTQKDSADFLSLLAKYTTP